MRNMAGKSEEFIRCSNLVAAYIEYGTPWTDKHCDDALTLE